MKKLTTLTLGLLLVLYAIPAQAQTATTRTATTAAISAGTNFTVIPVVSATGMTASTSSAPTYIAICDGPDLPPSNRACELMRLDSISGTNLTVRRGQVGPAVAHISGSNVWYGTVGQFSPQTGNTSGVFLSTTPSGSCTRASNTFLPVINTQTGEVSDCILSTTATTDQWVTQRLNQAAWSLPHKKLAVTATTYTALISDVIIGVNTNVASTITLPACTGCEGKYYLIQDVAPQTAGTPVTITVAGSSGQTVNGGASAALVSSNRQFQSAIVWSDGQNWFIGPGR